MTQCKLEDVEDYLIKWADGLVGMLHPTSIKASLRMRFTELRAREEAKSDIHVHAK